MAVKKIIAANMRRALEIAREQLGDDAIILSTRRHPDGIEMHATVEAASRFPEEQQAFAEQKHDSPAATLPLGSDNAWQHQHLVSEAVSQAKPAPSGQARPFGGKTGSQLADEIEMARQKMLAAKRKEQGTQTNQPVVAADSNERADVWASQLAKKSVPVTAPKDMRPRPAVEDTFSQQAEMSRLHQELSEMRAMLQARLQEPHLHRPLVATELVSKFHSLGLPDFQAERLIASVNTELPVAKAWPEALALLSQRIPTAGRDVIESGGVFAFIGPTGVGKTTTLAKLAVRFVIKHGAEGLAIVTTDNYRLAAHEQLNALGQILSVPVKVVSEGESLQQVLVNLSHKKLVLIDTAGLRHGDPKLKAQLEQLRSAGKVNSLLVMAANSQLQMLKASYHAYGAAHPSAVILTKLDETPSLGEAIGLLLQHRLPLAYTTDGQEIPADIQIAKGHQVVAKAAQFGAQSHVEGKFAASAESSRQVQSEQL
ncbi:flagellar biosynthesis protein FlhF [Simiduia curdlanivorans]|uniref:Flagellar biosynthesis protein FlhF n=1 Tax=Simiduia curdlanivorans TaxID=1492769 RepID=A0ABV8V9D6_9GAMM|nr:flagellar biosynthesis protein FlhF [Simiduia curdlanivorans]MDN3639874.1 flagellar biosynthesis protein FlhF [Simiduia curdlanivorans]